MVRVTYQNVGMTTAHTTMRRFGGAGLQLFAVDEEGGGPLDAEGLPVLDVLGDPVEGGGVVVVGLDWSMSRPGALLGSGLHRAGGTFGVEVARHREVAGNERHPAPRTPCGAPPPPDRRRGSFRTRSRGTPRTSPRCRPSRPRCVAVGADQLGLAGRDRLLRFVRERLQGEEADEDEGRSADDGDRPLGAWVLMFAS